MGELTRTTMTEQVEDREEIMATLNDNAKSTTEAGNQVGLSNKEMSAAAAELMDGGITASQIIPDDSDDATRILQQNKERELILNAPSSILLQRILGHDNIPGVSDAGGGTLQSERSCESNQWRGSREDDEEGAEETKEEVITEDPNRGEAPTNMIPPSPVGGPCDVDDVSTTSWEITKLVQSRQLGSSTSDQGVTTLYAHQSLGTDQLNVPAAPASPPSLETNDSSSLFTRDSSTLENQTGITKLYTHQSLGSKNVNIPIAPDSCCRNYDTESASSNSLPHSHYPVSSDANEMLFWNHPVSKLVKANPVTSHSGTITASSFEDIASAVPIQSTCESGGSSNGTGANHHTFDNNAYSRQITENSCRSNNTSLGLKSSGNSLPSTGKSTAQDALDLSTHSLADALITHDDEGGYYYYRGEEDDGGYSADESSFTLAARPIDDCSESGSSFAMMELKQALPMGESEDEESHTNIQRYGYGDNVMEMYNGRERGVYRPPMMMMSGKPVMPETFPSLLDSSMSSSYSMVSAPPSATPSFDNCADVPREGSVEEREDTLGYVGEPLAIEVPIPMTSDGSRYIVDLEQIAEESSGQDVGELSASSPGSGNNVKNAEESAALFAKTINEKVAQAHQEATRCQMIDENQPTPVLKPDQQIHRNPNDQFFNYRHKYYTEQYHYYDDDDNKYPSKGGDDDTDSTCSSVTLSQAFQRVHSDDDSFASSSFMTESSSNPTLSTVSSVTLSRALSVDRHDHSDQGFYVAVRLGDYVEGQNDEQIEVESVRGEAVEDVEERDVNEVEQKSKADSKDHDSNQSMENTSNDPGAGEDVLSDAPAAATKAIAESNERVESDILNMLIPECGVPIPSVMSKMGKQRSKGGMLLPWHSTRSIQNYQYGGGRRKKRSNMSSTSSLFSISSVHTFRG